MDERNEIEKKFDELSKLLADECQYPFINDCVKVISEIYSVVCANMSFEKLLEISKDLPCNRNNDCVQ